MDIKLRFKAFNPKIFRPYDIRGLFPEELDHNAIKLVAAGFVEYLRRHDKGNFCLIGQDIRESSEEIAAEVREEMLSRGADVLDAGVLSTPAFTFALSESGADGGIMITASHNDARFNGFKIYEENRSLSEKTGLLEIKNIIEEGFETGKRPRGYYSKRDFSKDYIRFLSSASELKREVRAVFDTGGGAVGIFLPELLKKLRVHPFFLYLDLDPELKVRPTDPLDFDAEKQARLAVLSKKAEVGMIFDPDGDRVIFLDEKGVPARSDAILWLLSKRFSSRGDTIVYDLRFSGAFMEDMQELGIYGESSRVGHSFVKEKMRESNALFAAELSGHFFFRDFFYSDSSLFAALKVLQIISESDKPLSELLAPYFKYFHSGEINFSAGDKDDLLSLLEKKYDDGAKNYLDGLTVKYHDWWFNARASNTEDVLRLVLEAKNEGIFEEKKAELLSFLEKSGARRI